MKPLIVAILALAFLGAGPVRAADPAGLVIDVQGSATLAGKDRLAILTGLPANAEVALAPGARVVVVHSTNGRQFELTGPGTFRWAGGRVEATKGGTVAVREAASAAFGDVSLRTARLAQASISMRGDAQADRIALVSPVSTWLLERPAAFRWQTAPGASRYRLALSDASGRTLHEVATTATSAELPASVALEPGRLYGWLVTAELASGKTAEGWSEFGVAGADLRARVEKARPGSQAAFGDRLIYALYLEELGMREDAGRLWSELARERPEDADLAARARR